MATKKNSAGQEQNYDPNNGQYTSNSSNNIDNAKIKTESVDAYYGQEDFVKRVVIDGKTIGYVEYSVYNEEPHIQMIEIDEKYRRKGLATRLLKDLQNDYPKSSVDFGMMTEEGKKLYESVTITKNNPQYTKTKNEYEKISKELKKMDEIWDKFYNDEISMSEEEVEKLNSKWIDYNNKVEKLQRKLENIVESTTYIK